jgi:cytochrome P450
MARMADIPALGRALVPGHFLRILQRNPIPFLRKLASERGDAVQFAIGRQKIVFLNHPDLTREVLITRHRSFHKSRVLQRSKVVLGEGLLTSEDEKHQRQRRLAQPAFHRDRINRYATEMIDTTAVLRDRWRDGETIDMHAEMMRLTLSIVAKTLFGADVEKEGDEIGRALTDLIDLFPMLMNPMTPYLQKLPFPSTLRFRRAIVRLDQTIYSIINERRADSSDRGDLLSMLLLAQDDEGDGSGMTDKQLRDEAMTIFLAGHETTANALSWTWMLLSQHPVVAEEMLRVIDEVLGDRAPVPEDYPRLQYVEMVLAESMRLYPPAWAVSRLALEDVDIGGWSVPRDAVVIMSQAVMHRDPRYWAEGDRFDPLRFTAEARAARPKLSYFPFGAGPRTCIGESFAWMEGVLLLTALSQRWRAELLTAEVKARATITLRPAGGMMMRLHDRRARRAETEPAASRSIL